jgi:hypothetical protein
MTKPRSAGQTPMDRMRALTAKLMQVPVKEVREVEAKAAKRRAARKRKSS